MCIEDGALVSSEGETVEVEWTIESKEIFLYREDRSGEIFLGGSFKGRGAFALYIAYLICHAATMKVMLGRQSVE